MPRERAANLISLCITNATVMALYPFPLTLTQICVMADNSSENNTSGPSSTAVKLFDEIVSTIKASANKNIPIWVDLQQKCSTELKRLQSLPSAASKAIQAEITEVNRLTRGAQDMVLLLRSNLAWIDGVTVSHTQAIAGKSANELLRFVKVQSRELIRQKLVRELEVARVAKGLGLEEAEEWEEGLEKKLKDLREGDEEFTRRMTEEFGDA